MCLSTVFEQRGEEKRLLREHISGIELLPGKVKLSDIMGAEMIIEGTLASIDLMKNEIIIKVN